MTKCIMKEGPIEYQFKLHKLRSLQSNITTSKIHRMVEMQSSTHVGILYLAGKIETHLYVQTQTCAF